MDRHRLRRGAIMIWVAVAGLALVGLAGLAIDTGFGLTAANQLQVAADASALAAAKYVLTNQVQARQSAHDVAYANKAAGKLAGEP